jgi:hypothetical protein
MARIATYGDLRADGEALRRRLVSLTVSVDEVSSLVGDIRTWETRVASAVSVRNPKHSAEFRVRSGPFQRLLGDGSLPDRLTFRAHILETGAASYRLRTSQGKRKEGPPAA